MLTFRSRNPRGHNLDKDAFVEFLKQGLEEYKKRGNN